MFVREQVHANGFTKNFLRKLWHRLRLHTNIAISPNYTYMNSTYKIDLIIINFIQLVLGRFLLNLR